jgi:HSP20 family molecular chaperone IbpA
MKVNKIFSYMGLLLVTLINIMFLSSGSSATLEACNRKVNSNWNDINPYRLKAGNSILDHMNEIFNIPASLNALIEQQQRQVTSMYYRSSPRYDIADNEDQMVLSFDLPGVNANDVVLTLLEEGKVLNVAGSRKYKAHGEVVVSEFDQMFRIDPSTLDFQTIEARLTDGVLVITAPKLLRTEEKERRIPIVVYVKNNEEKEETPMIENETKDVNQK